MRLRVGFIVASVLFSLPAIAQEIVAPAPFQVESEIRDKAIDKWEKAIQELEALDLSESHSPDEILMVGSSSVRRWSQIDVDMSPYRVIRRGYGGAKYSDLAVFADRLIQPHHYRAMVVFVGNDIAGSDDDHSVEQVDRWVRHIIDVSRRHQPDAPVMIIEVTPTMKRWKQWPEIRELNAQLREIALSTPKVYCIDTAEHFLDSAGQPRTELFADDNLHLSDQGYDIWANLIRSDLDDVFRLLASESARH
ncbi:GDSL-type esterase/lipase family protein [Rubripirellula reticaptiva]|uniref:SGNH hydrolase-type esterase domain-containing protein n=1 Tax=Rubripirellula reticaptiva TaxID=2528013 RepID=A0A5C6FCH0_9BACT|nr:GDSL-type esterase/lipase family protein [Rubripirellula reticaptiva]TWU58004.1 hypothetical protein Poly59_09130 [Rubripirellula reticaptiva]